MRHHLRFTYYWLVPVLILGFGTVLLEAAPPPRPSMGSPGGTAMPRPPAGGMVLPRPSVPTATAGRGSYGGMGGYGGSPGSAAGYGYGNAPMPVPAPVPNAEPEAAIDTSNPAALLKAVGLPTENGHLHWPPTLLALTSPATPEHELREQIDALYDEAARQAGQGPVNPKLAQELNRAVAQLRQRIDTDRPERYALPRASYDEATRFLRKLQHAARVMTPGLEPASGEPSLRTQSVSPEVLLSDDSFQPATITVPTGTTVRWLNTGQHGHTVTADDESWSSLALGPKDTYSHTFTQPGVYHYHCAMHPRQMQGTIVVK